MNAQLCELVEAETIKAGDEIDVLKLGLHVVSGVTEHGGLVVVSYFRDVEETYESSKGQGYGRRTIPRLVEKTLKPLERGELWPVRRGDPARAEQLRRRLDARIEAAIG